MDTTTKVKVHVNDLKHAAMWYAIREYDKAHDVPLPLFEKDRLDKLLQRFEMKIQPQGHGWAAYIPRNTRRANGTDPYDAAIRAALSTYKIEWEVPAYMMEQQV